ncbi:MAG: alpha/beta hydrolase [Pseudomonadota bacterium]
MNKPVMFSLVFALAACGGPGDTSDERIVAQSQQTADTSYGSATIKGAASQVADTRPGEIKLKKASFKNPLRDFITTATGHDLSYLHAGDPNGQPVIFVHGTPGSAGAWVDMFSVSPDDRFFLMSVDRPGFGKTTPNKVVRSLADQVRAIGALIERSEKPVILVGHSLGGPVVAWAAAEYPQKISGIVIAAGSLDPGLEKIHPAQYLGNAWPVSALLPNNLRVANRELLALKPELEMLADMLPDIRSDVIIVHGTRDKLVPYENVPFMQRGLSNAASLQIITLEGQNHFLP